MSVSITQKPIKPQSSHAPEACAWCTGTGKWAISAGYIISCMVCGGKGHISVPQPAEPCHACDGSGKRNLTNRCLTCAGTGWASVWVNHK